MKLSLALQIIRGVPVGLPRFRLFLNCGFTALHLQTFLQAFLQQALPGRQVEVESGLFGDVAGNLRKLLESPSPALPEALALPLEWTDLDSRLGYRVLGGWGAAQEADIVESCRNALGRLGLLLRAVSGRHVPVALSLPTLPLPPVFHTNQWESGSRAAELGALVASFAAEMTSLPQLTLVNAGYLDRVSPPASRLDLKSDIHSGLPFGIGHCSALAEALARLLAPPAPRKGLITDLDDTLWAGLVGEVGAAGVAWDLHGSHQLHGLYQQVLRALSEQGALLAVASKNTPEIAEQALARPDLLLPAETLFPREISWGAKSQAIERILRVWNIGAADAVFVDDSPLELAEVSAAFPELECILFPKHDFAAALGLFSHLRDRFGKRRLNEEDALRRESIRQARVFTETLASPEPESAEAFLASLEAVCTVHTQAGKDPRTLELINKTNQFNANGNRFEASGWRQWTGQPTAFTWAISYRDKFGPLGKISIAAGTVEGDTLHLKCWVLSCRAFSRRIEFQTLAQLCKAFPQVVFLEIDACATGRNQPFLDLARHFGLDPGQGRSRLSREACLAGLPALHHRLEFSSEETP